MQRFHRTLVVATSLTFALCVLSIGQVRAQVTIPQEYDKLIKQSGAVTAFGNEGFGDRIDLGSGGLQIVQTDVDLPGNNAIPVRVGRRFVPGDKHGGGHFGVWSLDIPYVHGIFANHLYNPVGWTVPGVGADQYKRCSQFSAPPELYFQVGVFLPDEYWHGNFFYLPGSGDQELLSVGQSAHVPSDGNTYPIMTKDGAVVRCVALASTSEAGSQGEGFEVITPDGLIYTMNHMVSRPNEVISKPIDQFSMRDGEPQEKDDSGSEQTMSAINFVLPRVEVLLYPTKVMDRFGNYVTYTWSATNPWQLLQMSASDDRQITLTYPGASKLVSSVSDGSRTWTYAVSSGINTVTLPDGNTWSSNLGTLFDFKVNTGGDGCSVDPIYIGTPPVRTGSVTAPTGATATYTMTPVKMARSWVIRECVFSEGEPIYAKEPSAFFKFAVVEKKITGPGLPVAGVSWAYAYESGNGCWMNGPATCTGSSPITRSMSVTGPDGVVNRYTFGNRFAVNEGQQLKVENGWNGTSAARVVDTTYANDTTAAPYWAYNGFSPRQRGDFFSNESRPVREVKTTQQGRTFLWQVATGCNGYPYCFDTRARPTKVMKSSSP